MRINLAFKNIVQFIERFDFYFNSYRIKIFFYITLKMIVVPISDSQFEC